MKKHPYRTLIIVISISIIAVAAMCARLIPVESRLGACTGPKTRFSILLGESDAYKNAQPVMPADGNWATCELDGRYELYLI